jgi:hypothetical protein
MQWKLFVALAACFGGACAATQSSERRRVVSECMAECRPSSEPVPARGPFDQNAGQPDQRNGCEQRCQSMK